MADKKSRKKNKNKKSRKKKLDKKSQQTKPDNVQTLNRVKDKGGRPSKARAASMSSDAGDARWTVRGVPSNVREMATKAAKGRGMTVGDWLAETIALSVRKDVSADETSKAVAMPQGELIDFVQAMNDRLTKVEKKAKRPIWVRWFGGQDVRQEAA
jgi:hypothetical protein